MSRPVRNILLPRVQQPEPSALIPENEVERLKALEDYEILDTLPEKDFDDITYLASHICGTPVSMVSLIDAKRQWLKSNYGIDIRETPREISFCSHAILGKDTTPFIVSDARDDKRFAQNPLVTGDLGVVFYAGVPLVNPEGFPLGTLCVIDRKPRELTQEQLRSLASLANMVMRQLEERRIVRELRAAQTELLAAYKELDQFSYVIAHDLKSPLNNIISLADLIRTTEDRSLSEETTEFLDLISVASRRLTSMIDAVLKFTRQNHVKESTKEVVNWCEFVDEVLMLLQKPDYVAVECLSNVSSVRIHKSAMQQILINLCSNALRFINREGGHLVVELREDRTNYRFAVTDNGPGIPEEHRESVFSLFHTMKSTEATGEGHYGVGLATVRKLVTRLGGTINVVSHVGVGTSFIIVLPKI